MRYRLALDLGASSLGWAIFKLNDASQPAAVVKAGVRIFSDGRNPKDGSSLAVTRRLARSMRRRRDRLLHRKHRMMRLLVEHGFFPNDQHERKALEQLNPYELRARGLDTALTPGEFARALFHINQRRGFKSNRKTDAKASDASVMKSAIESLRKDIEQTSARTVGELLWQRMQRGQSVRARYHETRVITDEGKSRINKSYDLYIDRAMVEQEFDALWQAQAHLQPSVFTDAIGAQLKDCLLFQRPLKPVEPGRCTLLPNEHRAPLALPSQQRFRVLQELNNLRIVDDQLGVRSLTLNERDTLADALERKAKMAFSSMRKTLSLPDRSHFNLEDDKRNELKGNLTSANLSKKNLLGAAWHALNGSQQDAVVDQLLHEESEATLIQWLTSNLDIDEACAQRLADTRLPEGYGRLSAAALERIVPALKRDVLTFDQAVIAAGFEHHSAISHAATGEILPALPYYGEYLSRHVAFGSNNPDDVPEKRFGKIANPTVHIGLNQVRAVVNALIKRYGHPSQVVIEVARELKQSLEQRKEIQTRQAEHQRRNQRLRSIAAGALQIAPERVKRADIEKLILWEELSRDPAERQCPYSGMSIRSAHEALGANVEIEHILPFSMTLDDSLNNKTLAARQANRIKGDRTPAQAAEDFARMGWTYEDIAARVAHMPRNKRYRFAPDGYEQWLRTDQDFLARALNDTAYLSRIAREYLTLVCPQATWVIPGRLTAMLRAKFGLNDILGLNGEKNRNDHRHHAVDACVIGVTDRSLLQRFASANAHARAQSVDRLVENMPLPWETYRDHVQRAVDHINVSHKPDHSYQGAIMEDTAYGISPSGQIKQKRKDDGSPGRAISHVIRISEPTQPERHGVDADGHPLPYKGYVGGNNHCIEITCNPSGKWEGQVISRFEAYAIAREPAGLAQLRRQDQGQNGQPLIMRLMIDDCVRMEHDSSISDYRLATIRSSGSLQFAPLQEANVDHRNRDKSDTFSYVSKTAGSLQKSNATSISISPIGDVRIHKPS